MVTCLLPQEWLTSRECERIRRDYLFVIIRQNTGDDLSENAVQYLSQSLCFKHGKDIRGTNDGHRPIGAELERMVTIEGLLMEAVSIAIQHRLNPLYPVVKDEF
jgi:hypothetical protein